jgi:hypothetical protein
MTASHIQSLNPSIVVYEPDPTGYTPTDQYLRTIFDADSYSHVVQALGGYWSARFTISDRQDNIEDWLDRGIGRHVEVYDNALVKIWEGFVDKVGVNLGALSSPRGPELNIGNRVSVAYSTVDTSENPPVMGVRARTALADDAASQASYGILQTLLSAGGMTAVEADQARDTYIAENKEPETSQSITLGGTQGPSVTVECLGYVHWFTKYIYNQVANSGTLDLDAKLQAVISADPNTLFDTGFQEITANTLAVQRYENKDKKAWDLIKSLVALGDASDNRYLFGVYDDRVPRYEAAPTTLEYTMRLGEEEPRIENEAAGTRVFPWNVLPGKWLLITDFLIGKTDETDLRLDPRAMFVESVTYTAPWGLTLAGGKTDKLSQQLAKLGLAGIGA